MGVTRGVQVPGVEEAGASREGPRESTYTQLGTTQGRRGIRDDPLVLVSTYLFRLHRT